MEGKKKGAEKKIMFGWAVLRRYSFCLLWFSGNSGWLGMPIRGRFTGLVTYHTALTRCPTEIGHRLYPLGPFFDFIIVLLNFYLWPATVQESFTACICKPQQEFASAYATPTHNYQKGGTAAPAFLRYTGGTIVSPGYSVQPSG